MIKILKDLNRGEEFTVNENIKEPEYEVYTPIVYNMYNRRIECRNRAGVSRFFDPRLPVYIVE